MLTYWQYWDIEKLLKYFRTRDISLFSRTPRKLYLKINQKFNFSTLQRKSLYQREKSRLKVFFIRNSLTVGMLTISIQTDPSASN